jgi:deoxyribose-phosphate aldolase
MRRSTLGEDTPVRIASVATAFPSGQAPLKTRLAEVKAAVADGADEIDMVINRGAFLAGEFGRNAGRNRRGRRSLRQATLKVILEVSELETYDNIRAASFLAMRVIRPGDFIKTSTGKTSLNATLGNNQVMLEAIRDFYLDTGIAIAMKPAGGIRTAKQALHVSHRGQRDARRRVAQQHPLPLRRLLAAERPAPPDRKGAHRRLPGPVLLQRGH